MNGGFVCLGESLELKHCTDKKDKEKPHLNLLRGSKERPFAPFFLQNIHKMDKFFIFLLLATFSIFSEATEYKLCATAQHEILCKWIEASRSEITCVRVTDSVDCLLKMQKKEADFGTFFPEEAFLAARFLGDAAVVLAEVRHPDRAERNFSFETVAVVRSNLFGGLSALKGLSYCHPGFSKAQYWSDRVLKAFEKKVVEHFKDDIKCNAAVRSAYEDDLYRLSMIFSKACRPGTWAVSDWWDKKLKREYHTLCDQCEHPNTCSYKVQNKGKHSDALRCLTLHGGNVSYTALEYVKEYFDLDEQEGLLNPEHKNPSHYSFLCQDGSTRPLTSSNPCSWIKQPWTAVIALDSAHAEMLVNLKTWLDHGGTEVKHSTWNDHLRNILTKGDGILKFRDQPTTITNYIKEGRSIPSVENDSCRGSVKWCTINKKEKKKCDYMSTAALSHGLPTLIECVEGGCKIDCLKKIREQEADVVYIDSELGYIARKVYNLTATAYLETQRTGNYYGVVVVKGNSIKNFKSLQGKKACFPQYNGLGWATFVEVLKYTGVISSRTCSSNKKVWNYFTKACVPGALDPKYNIHSNKTPDRLCKSCANVSAGSSCEATSSNPYYGEVGALRCLNNGDGDVAFLDFYTIQKYLGSNRQNTIDADIDQEDFKILCRDGNIQTFNMSNPDKCSFTQLNGGEVVTRNNLEAVKKNDIYNTLMELDDLFGITSRHYNPALKMFEPFDGESNVLFKESAVSLTGLYQTQNSFVNNYVKLLNSLENCMGESSSSIIVPSLFAFVFSVFIIFYQV